MGFRLNFSADAQGGVSASFSGQWLLQGYNGVLHGGVVSSLLDAAMTHCLFYRGIEAVTAELLVRYLRPVPLDTQLELSARLLSEHPPLYRLRAELKQGRQTMAYMLGRSSCDEIRTKRRPLKGLLKGMHSMRQTTESLKRQGRFSSWR